MGTIDNALEIDLSIYTDESSTALEEAINSGIAVYENPESSQEEVDAEIEKINAAVAGLELKKASDDYVIDDQGGFEIIPAPKPEEPGDDFVIDDQGDIEITPVISIYNFSSFKLYIIYTK